jgi:hypothetical protein
MQMLPVNLGRDCLVVLLKQLSKHYFQVARFCHEFRLNENLRVYFLILSREHAWLGVFNIVKVVF